MVTWWLVSVSSAGARLAIYPWCQKYFFFDIDVLHADYDPLYSDALIADTRESGRTICSTVRGSSTSPIALASGGYGCR